MNSFFTNHWDTIAQSTMMAAMLINGHTKNWKEWPTAIGRVAGLIVKILSLWTADKSGPVKR